MSFGFSVGDFVGTAQLAWSLYQYCYKVARGAPQDFQALLNIVNTTHSSIKLIQEEAMRPDSTLVRAGPDRVQMVKDVIDRVDSILRELQVHAKKFEKLGDVNRHKLKKFWDGVRWSTTVPELDGLRAKLMYQNGIMSLLLTSCGNSSLERIEASNTKLERKLSRIQGMIENSELQASKPSVAPAFGNSRSVSIINATLLKEAEVGQRRWSAVGIDEWINAARWWLLQGQFQMELLTGSSRATTSPGWNQGYANLIKASWILTDIIARHPQLDFLDSGIRLNVELLADAITRQLEDIDSSGLQKPNSDEILRCELQIWESQSKGPTLKPGKGTSNSGSSTAAGKRVTWEAEDEYIYFQGFGKYHRNNSTSLCIILFLAHKQERNARIILGDQSWSTLAEFHVGTANIYSIDDGLASGDQKMEFSTLKDRDCLLVYWRSFEEYRSSYDCSQQILPSLQLLYAIKTDCVQFIERVFEDEPALVVTSTPVCAFESLAQATHDLVSQYRKGVVAEELIITGSIVAWALKNKYHEVLICFLECLGIFVKQAELNEYNSLYDSACAGRIDVVRMHLLSNLEDVNDTYNRLPLEGAAAVGHQGVVDELLKAGANANAELSSRTALQAAAGRGHLAVVDQLLKAGAKVNAPAGRDNGRTALQAAAGEGHLAVVDQLLKAGAKVNAPAGSVNGRTALQAAAGGGHLAVVDQLLKAGAEVNVPAGRDNGRTTLQAAAGGGHLAVVNRLLMAGAEINAQPANRSGRTALQAATGGGHLAVVDQLLTAGAEINAQPAVWSGRTTLQAAAGEGHLAVVDRLLKAGAEINAQPAVWSGRTTLQAAAGEGHLAVVDQLLKAGAEVNAPAGHEDGRTALQAAAGEGHLAVVDQLLKAGAEVNAPAGHDSGRTALQAAAGGGHLAVVDQLLKAGAEVNAPAGREDGCTALQAAAEQGHLAVEARLREAGAIL